MMAGKQKHFTAESRDNVASLLARLPEKPKAERELAAKDIIASLMAEIRSAQDKGYTIEEIVNSFKQGGVEIGLTTLKTAMRQSTKKRQPKVALKAEHQDAKSRKTVTSEERQALRQETESALTKAATQRGVR